MSDINGIGSSGSNTLRITGMASGMDTEAMIKKMMAAENIRADKMKQDRTYVQWRQDGIRDVIKDLRDLRSAYLLIDSPGDTNLIKSGAYSGATITTTDSTGTTNNNLLTATALPGAVNGVSTVKVSQIAKSAKIAGISLNKNSANIVGDITLSDWQNKTIDFTINGTKTTITINPTKADKSDLVSSIQDAINSKSELNGKVKVSLDGDNLKFDSTTDSNIKVSTEIPNLKDNVKVINPNSSTKLSDLGISDTTFSITQGSKVSLGIKILSADTIQEAMNKIYSTQSNAGDTSKNPSTLYNDIQVSFSDLTKSLTIQTRNTGSSQSLQIVADSGDPINLTNLTKLGLNTTVAQGQDAEVTITPPGSNTGTTIMKSSNNFDIDNVAYNLIKEPEIGSDGKVIPYTATLTTKADSQKSFDKIKAFIDKYNALSKKISDKIQEKKEYNYKPLTDTQKKDMTDDQIKTWEDKAKHGILKNDGDLQSILYGLRNAFSDTVKSAGLQPSEIGIQTYGGLEAISKPGQLKIDETKLKAALETRGDQVMKMFTAIYSVAAPTAPSKTESDYSTKKEAYDKELAQYNKDRHDNMGVFKRIEDLINTTSIKSDGNLLKKAGYEGSSTELANSLTKNLNDRDKAIKEFQKKLVDKENRYYQMFAKLETAMNKMNSQQSWLTQQMGGK